MLDQLILSQLVMSGNADFFIEVFIVCYHPFELFINALSHVAHQLKFSTLSGYVIGHYPPSYFRFLLPFDLVAFAFSNLLYPLGNWASLTLGLPKLRTPIGLNKFNFCQIRVG